MARHALALLLGQARADAPRLLEAHADLPGLVNNAAGFYESSGATPCSHPFPAQTLVF